METRLKPPHLGNQYYAYMDCVKVSAKSKTEISIFSITFPSFGNYPAEMSAVVTYRENFLFFLSQSRYFENRFALRIATFGVFCFNRKEQNLISDWEAITPEKNGIVISKDSHVGIWASVCLKGTERCSSIVVLFDLTNSIHNATYLELVEIFGNYKSFQTLDEFEKLNHDKFAAVQIPVKMLFYLSWEYLK